MLIPVSRIAARTMLLVLLALAPWTVMAAEVDRAEIKGLDEQVQDIKKDVLNLSSELARLEEKLLFPSNTQVSVFVSMQEDDEFRLDSVQLKVNGKVVAQHLYTFRELQALQRGGVQRLYTGNVKTGEHNVELDFIGNSPSGGEYRGNGSYRFSKNVGPGFLEARIAGPDSVEQDVQFRNW